MTDDEIWSFVAGVDPDFVEAYRAMRRVPDARSSLTPRIARLVEFTINSAATHLNRPEILPSLRLALDAGATPADIVECLELSATVGIHAMNIGVPLLVEVLEEEGISVATELDARQQELKAWFERERGYWHPFWNHMLVLDPDMFEAYTRFSTVPWRTGGLSPAEKELVYISYDIAATHLYAPGTKLHIRNALRHGATVEQILEVMELASMLGVQNFTATIPLLAAELRDRGLAE